MNVIYHAFAKEFDWKLPQDCFIGWRVVDDDRFDPGFAIVATFDDDGTSPWTAVGKPQARCGDDERAVGCFAMLCRMRTSALIQLYFNTTYYGRSVLCKTINSKKESKSKFCPPARTLRTQVKYSMPLKGLNKL